MNISNMHRARPCFNCEPVAVDQHETFVDPDLGSITTGPMPEPVEAEPVAIEHDIDLGQIVVRARPDCHGGRRYTGPPVADLAFICFVAASIACTCLAACGLALAAGR